MKQPNPLIYVFGHTLVCLGALSVAATVDLQWVETPDQVPGMLPLIASAIAIGTLKAHGQVTSFKAWQRNWNRVAGQPPAAPRKRHWALALWLCALVLAASRPFPDAMVNELAALVFVLSSIWLLATFLLKAARWGTRRMHARTGTPAPHYVVEICQPVGRRSPKPAEIVAALPAYCQQLLQHQSQE